MSQLLWHKMISWLKKIMVPEWISAIAMILVVIVAIFQDRIRAWLKRAKLEVSVNFAPPDCHKTTLASCDAVGRPINVADCYYFRLRVKNVGNERAELVEVFAAELSKEQADGSFKRIDSFLPMNLVWSHIRKPFLDAISPGMEKLCDLGHIIDPSKRTQFRVEDNPKLNVPPNDTVFSFDLEVVPLTLSHLIPLGKYRLVIKIGAGNIKPLRKTLQINLTGKWFEDEAKMLDESIGIRIL